MTIDEDKNHIEIFTTGDGSHSLFNPSLNETYHSRHGAVQESQHVFISNGLDPVKPRELLRILEVGFGTGLNAWLTASWAEKKGQFISYTTLETFPLEKNVWGLLNYGTSPEDRGTFAAIHNAAWEIPQAIHPAFEITKMACSLQDYSAAQLFHLIYFDAFGPPTQPEMWTAEIFGKLFSLIEPGGVLVTYCAKGQVRRDMQSAGFIVERLPGPPGKREMLRATKTT